MMKARKSVLARFMQDFAKSKALSPVFMWGAGSDLGFGNVQEALEELMRARKGTLGCWSDGLRSSPSIEVF
jgi:hypothetical protein